MEKPEILAPAGSMESLKAAICAGADAVYIGGSSFGARAYAQNPDTEELLEAIRYVHLRGKRLYLTVNTLVKEREFSALYAFVAPYYMAGLDAAIVQDVGALRFLAREFPDLSLHASTQMTLTAAEGLRLFDAYPVTRLVPARELSLEEIGEICRRSGREVEIFVHGALCYSYSGQCLMSSLIGKRSGNRGRCAQPCRMEYDCGEIGKRYWLSPKDLCGLPLLPELIETGAASFKIEGRMKRPEYAAAVTAAYRRFTDLYESLGAEGYREHFKENPELLQEEVERLADIYNRGGFSTGCFLSHNGKALMSVNRPGHFGVRVGEVIVGGRGEALLRLEKEGKAQDVLELRSNETEAGASGYYAYTLGSDVRAGQEIKARLHPGLWAKKGDSVYRMKHPALLRQVEETYLKQEKKVEVKGVFYAKVGEKCILKLTAKSGGRLFAQPFAEQTLEEVTVCMEGFFCEAAGKLPATEEAVKRQLNKTGNEAFFFSTLEICLADAVFLPNGLLNELRRNAFARLSEAIEERYRRAEPLKEANREITPHNLKQTKAEHQTAVLGTKGQTMPYRDCLVSEAAQAEVAAQCGMVRRIYLDLTELGTRKLCLLAGKLRREGKEVFLALPRICRKKTLERIEREFPLLSEAFDGYLVRNFESLFLVMRLEEAWRFRCVLDANMYVMNREAKAFYSTIFSGEGGALTAPVELSAGELRELGVQDMTLIVYGRLPLMVSVHCIGKQLGQCGRKSAAEPFWLTDRVGKRLYIKKNCIECYHVIYNPECLLLPEEECYKAGVVPAAYRYDFTTETKEEVSRVLENAVQGTIKNGETGYTRGHFKRGVE